MNGLSEVYSPDQTVLEQSRLPFLRGVKIGVLGLNSAIKIALLQVNVGLVVEFELDEFSAEDSCLKDLNRID